MAHPFFADAGAEAQALADPPFDPADAAVVEDEEASDGSPS
jgi:hypothetical protein